MVLTSELYIYLCIYLYVYTFTFRMIAPAFYRENIHKQKILSMKIWYGKAQLNRTHTTIHGKRTLWSGKKSHTFRVYLDKFIIKLTCVNAQLQFFYANWRLCVNGQQKTKHTKASYELYVLPLAGAWKMHSAKCKNFNRNSKSIRQVRQVAKTSATPKTASKWIFAHYFVWIIACFNHFKINISHSRLCST